MRTLSLLLRALLQTGFTTTCWHCNGLAQPIEVAVSPYLLPLAVLWRGNILLFWLLQALHTLATLHVRVEGIVLG